MNNQEQMKFVYQALLNGWQVKYLGNETFEFKKRKNKFTQNIMIDHDIHRVLCERVTDSSNDEKAEKKVEKKVDKKEKRGIKLKERKKIIGAM